MIGVILALALQAQPESPQESVPGPASGPAPATAADSAADTLARAQAAQAKAAQDSAGAAPPPVEVPTRPPLAPPPNSGEATPPPAAEPAAPPTAYENGVRANFAARQARQGPLEGRWLLAGPDGKTELVLQLTDPGAGKGQIEGAWQDPGREGADSTGLLTHVERSGDSLTLSFVEPPSTETWTGTFSPGPAGRWVGELRRGGQSLSLVMTPSEVVAGPSAERASAKASTTPFVGLGQETFLHKAKAHRTPKRAPARKHRPTAAPKRAHAAAASHSRAVRHSASRRAAPKKRRSP